MGSLCVGSKRALDLWVQHINLCLSIPRKLIELDDLCLSALNRHRLIIITRLVLCFVKVVLRNAQISKHAEVAPVWSCLRNVLPAKHAALPHQKALQDAPRLFTAKYSLRRWGEQDRLPKSKTHVAGFAVAADKGGKKRTWITATRRSFM